MASGYRWPLWLVGLVLCQGTIAPILVMAASPDLAAAGDRQRSSERLLLAQNAMARLSSQLQQAVDRQNWQRAIQIVDQMITIAPSDQQARLKVYRMQLLALRQQTPSPQSTPGLTQPTPSSRQRSSPPPKPILTAYQRPTQLKDCGDDQECFLAAAKTCEPASGNFKVSLDFFGIDVTATGTAELWGRKQGQCIFYSRSRTSSNGMSASGRQRALEKGATEAELAKVNEELIRSMRQTPPSIMACQFRRNTDLVAWLETSYGKRRGTLGGESSFSASGSFQTSFRNGRTTTRSQTQETSPSSFTTQTLDGRKVALCESKVAP